MNFKDELEQKAREVEAVLKKYLPKEEGFPKNLAKAMNYSMEAGGKRLRPIFMEEMYRVCGGTSRIIEPFMAAMEMIHTHSLIHDDLPAIDNDAYRRGKETTHIVFGEAAAILAGDALLNYAYETAFQAFSLAVSTEETLRIARALEILGKKTGLNGMLGGQSVDVENDGRPLDRKLLDYIYVHKTSALIEASLLIGGVLAGSLQMDKLEQMGRYIGLAFQIQDDILDVTSSQEELGKPVGSDQRNHKTTYVTLEGIEEAGREVKRLTEEATGLLKSLPGDTDFLEALFFSLCGRRK